MRLFPRYALQTAMLAWLSLWIADRLQRHLDAAEERGEHLAARNARLQEITVLLRWTWPWVATLALVEWTLHGIFLFNDLTTTGHPQWLTGSGEAAVALLAAMLLLALGIRQACYSQRDDWVYGVAVFGGAIGLYIRALLVGLAPASVWDTTALMVATYGLFILQRLTRSEPLFHVVMALPLLTLFTIPLQLASPHAGGTFMTAGVLYLLTHRETDRPLPLYLALLAFNAALYLWVPGWASRYHVFQVYVVPAALSVLCLLHFHRQEVQPSVLNSARLAATSALYASATLDVFLQAALAVFIVALALSIGGVIIGIALRTRAFLYSGVAFLVLNVLGQLLLLFPDQRLGKAIVLLVLGAAITGGMIWFNLRREAILQRIRIFRADLETWA